MNKQTPGQRRAKRMENDIKAALEKGGSIVNAAQILDLAPNTMAGYMRYLGIETSPSEDKINARNEKIRTMAARGSTQKEIGKAVGCHPITICNIMKRLGIQARRGVAQTKPRKRVITSKEETLPCCEFTVPQLALMRRLAHAESVRLTEMARFNAAPVVKESLNNEAAAAGQVADMLLHYISERE